MVTIISACIGVIVVAVYALWRYEQAIQARARFANLVPPRNRLSWNIENKAGLKRAANLELPCSDGNSTALGDSNLSMTVGPLAGTDLGSVEFLKDPLNLAAAADGIVAAAFIADAALGIDPHVLQALEFSTAEHLHGLADIDSYVQSHFFDVPVFSAEGWFERLTGYVAEQKAATALDQLGHHVEFAPVANQPMWDLLVDGHPVQIKEGLAGAKDFVLHHPGVDVFTGPDVAAAIKDPSVHALDVLDKDSIHVATEQSLNGVDGVVDPGLHFPFITMAFSSYREARLLWNEKTTFERALVHVGIDVVGVSGGALAGAKAGGLLGTVFGPPGTVVGSIVGSIAGAICGKLVSTSIRKATFREARAAYDSAVSNAQEAVESEISRSKQRIAELQTEYQQKFIQNRTKAEQRARRQVAEIRLKFEDNLLGFCERFPVFLSDLKTQLEREEQEVLSRFPSRGVLAWVLASDYSLYRGVVKAWFTQAQKLVDQELKTFAEITPRTVDTLHAEIQNFLKGYEFELDVLASELRGLRDQYVSAEEQAEQVRRDAVAEVTRARNDLIQSLGQQVMALHQRMVSEIQSWNRTIRDKKLVLKREAAAIGIEL
jgi:uncharacterized membrane-anchored protein YhcB (DUF1043 family)